MGQRIERSVLTCLKPPFKKWQIASFHLSVHTAAWNIICLLKKQLFIALRIISHWKRKQCTVFYSSAKHLESFLVAKVMKNLHPHSNYWYFNSTQNDFRHPIEPTKIWAIPQVSRAALMTHSEDPSNPSPARWMVLGTCPCVFRLWNV